MRLSKTILLTFLLFFAAPLFAGVVGVVDIEEMEIFEIDADPSVAPGINAKPGSLALFSDAGVGKLYFKHGVNDTDWFLFINGPGGSGAVTSFKGRIGDVFPQFNDYQADLIQYTPTGNLTGIDLQTALDELEAQKIYGASNIGGGASLFSAKSGIELEFRTLTSPLSSISRVVNGDEVELDLNIDGVDETTDIEGTDYLIIHDGSAGTIKKITQSNFYSAGTVISFNGRAGAVVSLSDDYTASQITNVPAGEISSIQVQGAINELATEKVTTASNQGSGVGFFDNKNGTDLELRTLTSPNSSVGIALNAPNKEVELTVAHNQLSNIQGGTLGEYYHLTLTDDTNLNTLTDGSNADALHIHDHGNLTGLNDDDHPQYLNETKHDALPFDNPHSVTFTQSVAADSNTDITTTETETLTDGSNADALHIHDATIVTFPTDGITPTDTVYDVLNFALSAGIYTGGEITDAGGGTVDIAGGTALIRDSDSHSAPIKPFTFTGLTGATVPVDTTRFAVVDYNSGAPIVKLEVTDISNYHSIFRLGGIINDGGVLHILNNPQIARDPIGHGYERFYETRPFERAERSGGIIIGETGTRNVTLTSGELYDGLNEFLISTIDTSGADTFDAYYRDGVGGFNFVTGLTQWPNLQYDDGTGTLANLPANRFANLWFYIEADGDLVMLYGRNEYTSLALAQAETAPATIPQRLLLHGRLIGRFIFQQAATVTTSIESVFNTTFGTTGVSNHNDLGGLQGGTAGEYYHITQLDDTNLNTLTDGSNADALHIHDHGLLQGLLDDDHTQYLLHNGTRAMSGNLNMGTFAITNVGNVDGVDVSDHSTRHEPTGADPLTTATAITLTPDNGNAEGVNNSFARSDHSHNVPTATAVGLNADSTSTQGAASSFARSNHTHAIASGVVSTQNPDQTNSAGTSVNFARADHIHNIPADVAVTVSNNTNAEGVSTSFSRADHTHKLTPNTPATGEFVRWDGSNWNPRKLLIDYQEEETDETTTLITFTQSFRATVTIPQTDDYMVEWYFEIWNETDARATQARVQLDDTTDLGVTTMFAQDNRFSAPITRWTSGSGFKRINLTAGSHNFDFDVRSSEDGRVSHIRFKRLSVKRLN